MSVAEQTRPKAAAATTAGAEARADAGTLERARRLLHDLGFEFVPDRLPELLETSIREDRTLTGFLEQLLQTERHARDERRLRTALKLGSLGVPQLREGGWPLTDRSRAASRPPAPASASCPSWDSLLESHTLAGPNNGGWIITASRNTVHFRMTMASLGCLVGCGQLACLARLGG